MNAGIVVRPMRVPGDCEGVARVRSACFPEWPVSGDEVAAAEARRPRTRLHLPAVAALGDALAGYGFVEEPNVAARPGRIRIRVMVDPRHRRRGVGATLYRTLEERAKGGGADELVTETRDDEADAPGYLARRGFAEYHRRLESRLPLADVDPAQTARAIDACTDAFFPTGVRIATFRQLAQATADAPRRLYELDALLWPDVPFGVTGSLPTFEEYAATELADPAFLPEASFIALDGDAWVGMCTLTQGPGWLLTAMTGVARAWRGRGLARWLKLHSIRAALERGAAEIRTFNDAVNGAILGLNRSLGFRLASTELRYRKELQ
jgi:GNAT superfamily N-acetyltransferase